MAATSSPTDGSPARADRRTCWRQRTSFAVIPGFDFNYAPFAPFNPNSSATNLGGQPGYVNASLRVGDQITLGASSGLRAGTYTLLPARYALLPGAFLVTPRSGIPVGSVELPDGASLVSGYRVNSLDGDRSGVTLMQRFEVAPSEVFRQRAQYEVFSANTFLREAAIDRDFACRGCRLIPVTSPSTPPRRWCSEATCFRRAARRARQPG